MEAEEGLLGVLLCDCRDREESKPMEVRPNVSYVDTPSAYSHCTKARKLVIFL